MERRIAVSTFKATCLGLLEEISETGEEIIVTKRGRPLARVQPVTRMPSLVGSVSFLVTDEELIEPIDQAWNVDHDDRP